MERSSEVKRIGELSRQFGLNPKTIRYYEACGLLPPPQRTSSGYRTYEAKHETALRFIARAKRFGFTLDEIRSVLDLTDGGERPCRRVLAVVERKVQELEAQIHALQSLRERLEALRRLAEAPGGTQAERCRLIEDAALEDEAPQRLSNDVGSRFARP